jgi:hypothetical protein
VEAVATFLLDLVADLLKAIRATLDAPLNGSTVLTWIWENLLRPRGNTEPLTMGRLACLASALPVTLAVEKDRDDLAPAEMLNHFTSSLSVLNQVVPQGHVPVVQSHALRAEVRVGLASAADEREGVSGDAEPEAVATDEFEGFLASDGFQLLRDSASGALYVGDVVTDAVNALKAVKVFRAKKAIPVGQPASAEQDEAVKEAEGWGGSAVKFLNIADSVAGALVQLLYVPYEAFKGWSKATSGERVTSITWCGFFVPIVWDIATYELDDTVTLVGDIIAGASLTVAALVGALLQRFQDDPKTADDWDVAAAFFGPLPWAGQALLLPEVVEPTYGGSAAFQILGIDFCADVPIWSKGIWESSHGARPQDGS